MRRKIRTKPYSNEFVLIVILIGIAFALSANVYIALTMGVVGFLVYIVWEIKKELQRRKAFQSWFHNHRDMDNLDDMTPLQFEVFVGELFTKLGYSTQMTPRSGDEGIDVIARKDNHLHAIQVKKSAKPVGSPVIQTLMGSMAHVRADFGICVSASGFTSEANRFAWGKKITLLGPEELIELLKKIS